MPTACGKFRLAYIVTGKQIRREKVDGAVSATPVSETRVVIEYRYIKAPGRDSIESSGACVRHVSE